MTNRIIIMASTFPRWDKDSVPSFVQEQAEFFSKNYPDMDIHILAPHHKGALKYEKSEHYTIHRFQYFWPANLQGLVYPAILPNLKKNKLLYLQIPFLFLFEFFALTRLVSKIKPNYIYAHWFLPQGIVGALVSSIFKIPVIMTSHSSDVMIMKKVPLIGNALTRSFIRKMQAITVVSKRSYEKVHAFFNPVQWDSLRDKVRIIPMGVNYKEFQSPSSDKAALKQKYNLEDKTILFFIGRLAEKKGVKYLLQAVAELVKDYHNLHLIVAGDGPLKESLEQTAHQLGIKGYVTFAGYTVGQSKYDYFEMSDIVLLPSIIADDGDAEGLPVSLMEGLAFGKICVATNVSGADDILIDKENGFLIRDKEVTDIVNAVKDIIILSKDEKEAIRKNAKITAEKLDWNIIVKEHYDFFFEECKATKE